MKAKKKMDLDIKIGYLTGDLTIVIPEKQLVALLADGKPFRLNLDISRSPCSCGRLHP